MTDAQPAIECRSLSFSWGDNRVLQDISFALPPGSLCKDTDPESPEGKKAFEALEEYKSVVNEYNSLSKRKLDFTFP